MINGRMAVSVPNGTVLARSRGMPMNLGGFWCARRSRALTLYGHSLPSFKGVLFKLQGFPRATV